MPRLIPPVVGDDDRFFWDGARRGELLLQRCAPCGQLRHPPAPMCPHCRSLDWDTVPSTGRGTIYSWIVSHHPSEDDTDDRVVVLVELDEGVRLVSNLVGVPWTEVRNDQAVEVLFADVDGVVLPQFRLATPGAPR